MTNVNDHFNFTIGHRPFVCRVIELVVRTERGLTREVVKHLNLIEESVLELLSWSRDSPLWTALDEFLLGI